MFYYGTKILQTVALNKVVDIMCTCPFHFNKKNWCAYICIDFFYCFNNFFPRVSYIRVSGIRQPCSTSPPLVSSQLLRQPSRGWRELNAGFSCKGQRTSQGRFYDPKPSLSGSVALRLLYLQPLMAVLYWTGFYNSAF